MQVNYQRLINLRKIACHNRLSDDVEVYVENAYRHYSKTYHTPLHIAKQILAPEEVVLITMSDEMLEWSPEEVLKIQDELNTSDRPVLNSTIKQDQAVSEDEWIADQERILKQQMAKEAEDKKKAETSKEEIAKKTHEVIENLTKQFTAATKMIEKNK